MTQFDERQAILMAMEEYKEQNRMDHDLYLTSRKMRNEQYDRMLDRLRILDERDAEYARQAWKQESDKQLEEIAHLESEKRYKQELIDMEAKLKEKEKEEPAKVKGTMPIEDIFRKEQDIDGTDISSSGKKKLVHENIKKEKRKAKAGKAPYFPFEKVAPVVMEFIKEQDKPVRRREIQDYASTKLNHRWNNFHSVLDRIVHRYPDKIHRENGDYTYIPQAPVEEENIAEEFGFKKNGPSES